MKIAKHISAANKLFNKKHDIAALTTAYIANGLCTVGDLFAQYTFPVKIKGKGCIDWIDLRAVLKAGLTSGYIDVKEGEVEGTARLWCNTTELTLSANSTDGYPLIEPGPLKKAVAFPCNLLLTANKFTNPLDPDMGIVPLNGIYLHDGYVTSTNGAIIYRQETHQPVIDVIIPNKVISLLQPCGHVTIQVEEPEITSAQQADLSDPIPEVPLDPVRGKHSVLKMEDAVIVAKNIEGTFPEVRGYFFHTAEEISLNRRMINAGLERLASILNDTSVVRLEIVEGQATLSAESENPDKSAEVDLGTVQHFGNFVGYFNADNLALAMSTDTDEFLLGLGFNTESKIKSVYVNGNILYQISDYTGDSE